MTAASSTPACVLDARAALGECPQWSIAEQALYWIDIDAPSLNRFDPASGRNVAMPMPRSIGSYALREGGGFVVALRDGIWLCDAHGTLERRITAAPYDPAHHRFNDGRCDARGRLFAGYMNEARDASSAALLFPPLAFFLYQAVFRGVITNRIMTNPWVTTIGGMCYTIYLFHNPLIGSLAGLTKGFVPTGSYTLNVLAQGCIILPVVLAACALYFVTIERPCMRRDWPGRLAERMRSLLARPAVGGIKGPMSDRV